jgi:hypothetical protein
MINISVSKNQIKKINTLISLLEKAEKINLELNKYNLELYIK